MGNYFGRKKEEGNDPTQDAFYGVEVKKSKTSTHTIQTVYRPHIFIDFYKSELFKVRFSVLKNAYFILKIIAKIDFFSANLH